MPIATTNEELFERKYRVSFHFFIKYQVLIANFIEYMYRRYKILKFENVANQKIIKFVGQFTITNSSKLYWNSLKVCII